MRASGGGGGSFARRPRRGAFQGLAGRVRRPRAQNTPAVLDSASRKCAASPSPPPPLLSPALPRCCELFTQAPLLRCLKEGRSLLSSGRGRGPAYRPHRDVAARGSGTTRPARGSASVCISQNTSARGHAEATQSFRSRQDICGGTNQVSENARLRQFV